MIQNNVLRRINVCWVLKAAVEATTSTMIRAAAKTFTYQPVSSVSPHPFLVLDVSALESLYGILQLSGQGTSSFLKSSLWSGVCSQQKQCCHVTYLFMLQSEKTIRGKMQCVLGSIKPTMFWVFSLGHFQCFRLNVILPMGKTLCWLSPAWRTQLSFIPHLSQVVLLHFEWNK